MNRLCWDVINYSEKLVSFSTSFFFLTYDNKYPHERDARSARFVLDHLGLQCFDYDLVQEGGGIHLDGEGIVLVTENYNLNKNRNPELTKADVETYLSDYIGVSKVIWLNGDIPYYETDGHIDGLACFIRPGIAMGTTTQDKNHADYEVLKANLETLKNSTKEVLDTKM